MSGDAPGEPLSGSCQCGAVTIAYHTRMPVEALRVARCGCSFCRRHGARTSTDPDGLLEITARPPGLMRYGFAFRTADFLICRGCGVYVGAVAEAGDALIGTLNVNVLDARDRFDPAPPLVDYSAETAEARRRRRRTRWTPARLVTDQA